MDTRIAIRLAKLDEYVSGLQPWASMPLDEYLANTDVQAIVERRLQLAIQVCIDIANYLIAHHGLSVPDELPNVFDTLGRAEVIPPELGRRMTGMVRFRNILVHGYTEVDPAIVHANLAANLGDLDEFGSAIARLYGL